jgi:hypothetical protein
MWLLLFMTDTVDSNACLVKCICQPLFHLGRKNGFFENINLIKSVGSKGQILCPDINNEPVLPDIEYKSINICFNNTPA